MPVGLRRRVTSLSLFNLAYRNAFRPRDPLNGSRSCLPHPMQIHRPAGRYARAVSRHQANGQAVFTQPDGQSLKP